MIWKKRKTITGLCDVQHSLIFHDSSVVTSEGSVFNIQYSHGIFRFISDTNFLSLLSIYRDSEQDDKASSLDSKDELSDSDSGVSEMAYKRRSDRKFVNHYQSDPSWRASLGRQQRQPRDRNLIEHTTEESDEPDDTPGPRALKSFSVMSLNRADKPPAYDGRRYMTKSADHLDRIQPSAVPLASVTSFMSPEYERRQNRPALRDLVEKPRSQSQAARPEGPLHRSRDEDDSSSSPHSSPVRSVIEGFSYGPRREPRRSSFRKALEVDGTARDSDGSSRFSDRGSSSSNDHRDTGPAKKPVGIPRIQYEEEPGRKRRQQPAKLQLPTSRYRSPSPSTPLSPAPSYHAVDPVRTNHSTGGVSPASSYQSSSRDPLSDYLDGTEQVLYLEKNGRDNGNFQSSQPHISNYSSFV